MKCQTVHSVLLKSENPSRLPAEVVAHIRGCASCQAWRRRLIHLERHVALLTVPPTPTGKAAFVRQFLAAPAEISSTRDEAQVETPETVPVDTSTMIYVGKFNKLAAALRTTLHAPQKTVRLFPAPARRRIAAVLAASLLFLAFGLWTTGPIGPYGKKPLDPLLTQVMARDIRLAAAQSPRERVETLADLADDLEKVTLELFDAAGPDELTMLAECYGNVVEGIVEQAKTLPAEDRAGVLDGIAARLQKAVNEAERLALVRPAASAGPLRTIATAARRGEGQLPPHRAEPRAMNRPFESPPVLFASVAIADFHGTLSLATRAELLRRNRRLIESVVRNSISLAGEQEALKRAAACSEMVEDLAHEIRQAADAGDAERALELADHLGRLLKQGVAANLAAARSAIPFGSADEKPLQEIQFRTAEKMRELEEELPAGTDSLDDRSLSRLAVRDGRAEVEKAVKWVKAGN